MIDQLLQFDYALFELVNIKGHNALLDMVIPFLRNAYFWAPLYAFIGFFMYYNYGTKGLIWILFFLLTFMLADMVSASLLKPFFMRNRPCQEDYWIGKIKLLVDCGVGKSFPSTHACNHFALSLYMITTLRNRHKHVVLLCLCWAALVAFAQVYVGVHYPLDVSAGALVGVMVGWFCGKYFNLRLAL